MRAPRPVTISFIEGGSCTFDSNDFVEFAILTHDLPMGEIVFKGSPFTDAGLTEIGRCDFDYCDHGLYVFQELANKLYEAQHPWLDFEDAQAKNAFNNPKAQPMDYLVKVEDVDYSSSEPLGVFSNWIYSGDYLNDEDMVFTGFRAFKPLNDFGYYPFHEVKTYTS